MTDDTIYLSPGFFLTLGKKRQTLHFSQLPGLLRRVTPARLAIIDALNQGFHGQLDELATDLNRRFNAKPEAIRHFVQTLEEAGYLTGKVPAARFLGEPSGTRGTAGTDELNIATPVSLVSQAGQYLWYDHDGKLLVSLSLPEVIATGMFCEPINVTSARELYLEQNRADGLDAMQFDALVSRLAGAELLIAPSADDDVEEHPAMGNVNPVEIQSMIDARVAAHDEMMANAGKELIQVVPVNTQAGMAPASLGMLMAYAIKYDGGRLGDQYDFIPMFLTDEAHLIDRAARHGIFLFSNYIWNVEDNLKLSAAVKAINPHNITLHGGPSTPSYAHDCEKFFADNPHVDIAVRGEGELTFAEILAALDLANSQELGALQNVTGITYRTADGVRRTADRERITDLDTIPSPFLMGLFNEFGSVKAAAIIETNRGCPYGCTFCDWGSATLSKVRRFDLDRVFKELEWCAKHQIEGASIADANFGMLERDVSITEYIAELRRTYGYPRTVNINYAKNQVKYLRQIIEIMSNAKILAEGVISLQSMDENTLKVIDRSNIKLEKYDEISKEFRRAKLPLAADIMMGMPGSTPAAFSSDLQKLTDRDIRVRAHTTTLLPNSPMNDPSYRKEHGIVALPGETVKETATYTRQQWDEMEGLRMAYYLLDCYGILRYVARYVRRETGTGEVTFYDNLQSEVRRHPLNWPLISIALRTLEGYMAPPGSWGLFIEEVRRYLVEHLGMPDDSGLRTTLAVQLAHLPATGRVFPLVLHLEHDFAAWQEALFTSREEEHRDDWQDHIPRLAEYGPATLTVNDPNDICRHDIGKPKYMLEYFLRTWELDSPVARGRLRTASN